MKTLSKFLLVGLSLLSTTYCREKSVKKSISVSAKHLDGSAIPEATIHLNDEMIGQTNAFGTFKDTIKLSLDGEYTVTVTHDDPSYYYSPHIENLKISDNSQKNIIINATLYLVPKPKKVNLASESGETPSTTKSEQPKTEQKPLSSGQELPLVDVTLDDLVQSPSSESNTLQKSRNLPRDLFTVHVHNGHAAIAGAEVLWVESPDQLTSCHTNERGRCLLWKNKDFEGKGSLLIRKPGYQSTLQNLHPTDGENIRSKLSPGATTDLQLDRSEIPNQSKTQSVRVVSNHNQSFTPDINGFVVIPKNTTMSSTLEFFVPGFLQPITLETPSDEESYLKLKLPAKTGPSADPHLVFNTHVYRDKSETINPEILTAIQTELIKEAPSIKAQNMITNFSGLKPGQILFLPILENSGHGMKLTLVMIDPKAEVLITEQTDIVDYSKTSVTAAVQKTLLRLRERQSIWGTIERTNGDTATVLMDGNTTPGERVSIKVHDENIEARITDISKDRITIKFPKKIDTNLAWRLSGAPTVRLPNRSTTIGELATLLEKLVPADPDFYPIDLSRKHLAELNPKAAIEVLKISDSDEPRLKIMKLNLLSQAYLMSGDKSESLKSTHQALYLCVEQNFERASKIFEINSLRLRADLTPIIFDESSLAATISDLLDENAQLTRHYTKSHQNKFNLVVLELVRLMLQQKLAAVTQDTRLAASLNESRTKIEKEIPAFKLTAAQEAAIMSALRATKNYASTMPNLSNQKM